MSKQDVLRYRVLFVITARKRSLRRLCFYRCLSFCPRGGGVRGCSGGGMHGCSRGACMVAWGACVVARGGMHGCSGGVCMVALGGHAWLLWGGMHGCSQGGMHGCSGGGVHGFSNEIRSMSRRYASYWNAFLLNNIGIKGLHEKRKKYHDKSCLQLHC